MYFTNNDTKRDKPVGDGSLARDNRQRIIFSYIPPKLLSNSWKWIG